ncbi:RNA polymerase-binding transcription factor DksA [Candidatus Hepatincolaceae symbiont of Richtersius coronifer]
MEKLHNNVNFEKHIVDYTPTENEEFMNNKMRAYFKRKLLLWKAEVCRDHDNVINNIRENTCKHGKDDLEIVANDIDITLELNNRERACKVLEKIDKALKRIENDEYGYCIVTGEKIPIKRLEAHPITLYSVEVQEKKEKREKLYI